MGWCLSRQQRDFKGCLGRMKLSLGRALNAILGGLRSFTLFIYFLKKFILFIFIFGCVLSSLLHAGFL